MLIAVIDKSAKVSTADAALMTAACNTQLRLHACPAWNRAPSSVQFVQDETKAPAGAWVIALFDNADQSEALGWHTETPAGLPYGRVFVKPILASGGTMLSGELSVSAVLSHEVLELAIDPNVNLWATAADGSDFCLEICDPVENDSYTIKLGDKRVSVSNFVLPDWFDAVPAKGARFDYMGKLRAPFTMTAGGYVIYKRSGAVHEKFGAAYPAWKRPGKSHAAARSARRLGKIQAG